MEMDGRKPESKKQYFQVLLQLQDRLRTNTEIHSDQPQSYFKCVLRDLVVDPGLGDIWYKKRLQLAPGEMLALPAPPVLVPIMDVPLDIGDFDIVGMDSIAPKARAPRIPIAKAKPKLIPFHLAIGPPPVADPSSSSSSSSSSSGNSIGFGFDVVGRRSAVTEWHELMDDGPRIKLDSYKPAGKQRYQRFIAECNHHHGCKCTKKRNANQTASYGASEPIAFLFAWAEAGHNCSADEHKDRKFVVQQARIAHFVGKLGARAKALTDLVTDK
jgi:hypothetical protein